MTSSNALRSRLDAVLARLARYRRDPGAQQASLARRLTLGMCTNADVEQYLASQDEPVLANQLQWQWGAADDEFRHRAGQQEPALLLLVEVLNHHGDHLTRSAWLARLLDLATTGSYQSEEGTTIEGTLENKSNARVAWRLLADHFDAERRLATTQKQGGG